MSRDRLKSWWPPLAVAVLFVTVWQLSTVLFNIEKWKLPSPLDIIQEASQTLPRIWMYTSSTLELTLIGYILGVCTGLVLAVLIHFSSFFRSAFYPFLIISQNIPIIALGPLLMMWFGLGMLPKILLVIIVCFFPITLSLMNGFAQTDTAMLNYMQMSGATKRQLFWKLELPHAIPFLFSGLKISATYSVMAAFVAEWLGSNKGIGAYMIIAKSAFRADRVFIGIFVIIIFSLAMFGSIHWIEKWFTRWKRSK